MSYKASSKEIYAKAQTYAYWSYVGVIIPIIGIILAKLSLSLQKQLKPKDDTERNQLIRIRAHAVRGMAFSVILLLTFIPWLIYSVYQEQQAYNELEKAQTQYLKDLEDLY